MRHESNNIQHEAKHVANELHHLHGAHNEKALHHIQKELHDEHKRDPHHFNQLLKDIQKDLKKDHDHRHLGIEHDHKGQVSHVNFAHHDIYDHAAKKQEPKRENLAGKPAKGPAPYEGDSFGDSAKSRLPKPDAPIKPDLRPETIAKILAIKGTGQPTGSIPYEIPGRDGNGW